MVRPAGSVRRREGAMEGRMNVVEGRLEHIEMAVDGMKAKSAANRQESMVIRKDIQELMRMMGARAKTTDDHSDESQGSVNDHGGGRPLDGGGGGGREHPETLPN
ncbi:hypothetical protein LR48_Vigan06g145900 [Vigna angularis]|uniref:Uncharacterized protein n=1 Tax=Phaseolus angularis TaxID=3914 RepID=A0A0L9UTS8_PHAAN|nr:hypothetical protein LR48_Vigan06g145900 [Vigna angularis]